MFGTISFIAFFFALGSAGALEQDIISLQHGALQMTVGIGAFGLFAWLAGGFR
ncbi:MAG: hypothetical protein RR365_03880 [Bacteroides sp.]